MTGSGKSILIQITTLGEPEGRSRDEESFIRIMTKHVSTYYNSSESDPDDVIEEADGRIRTTTKYPELLSVTSSITSTIASFNGTVTTASGGNILEGLIVPLYATIFLLAVVGNCLVLVTLARNKRMRTVTNVYLLNLAVSDLLLGVFCMPFTLLGQMLKNFVFGTTMCKLIPYFQAVSVSVGVWTLVAISLERYFAICRPLKSRRWQTQFHAYKMIAVVWAGSLTWNAPILAVSRLKAIRGGRHKCREEWPSIGSERAYNLFLDGMLLLIPLVIMSLAYSLIVTKLWRGLRREIKHSSTCQQQQLERTASSSAGNGNLLCSRNDPGIAEGNVDIPAVTTPLRHHRLVPSRRDTGGYLHGTVTPQGIASSPKSLKKRRSMKTARPGAEAVKLWLIKGMVSLPRPGGTSSRVLSRRSITPGITLRTSPSGCANEAQVQTDQSPRERLPEDLTSNSICEETQDTTYTFSRHAIRSNYMDKSIEAKKKVIRMLFVVVLEFFVCWAPLHVVNTWYLFAPDLVYSLVGSTGISLVQLLAYVSSCCNPITYCFMNRKFRQAFLSLFDCYRCWSAYCDCAEDEVSVAAMRNGVQAGNSDLSGNDSTIYLGRASLMARSVVLLEAEDRV
ncbi:cholecystokinin receptor type A-like isoform X2 [Cephus cinctus]|uniref:Cholecystokinin receptor type A-like isoform X2 n=1 Tax=Cephus cinctus TaxID=211228 RepID=A0AAJ7RGY7_CEPCN|nr:cholecystokinin receptor type A-like isoform X2 [Cephus cinctus]